MIENRNDDILHWVTLVMILDTLVDEYWYKELSNLVKINCFLVNPTKQSCLKFLRKTDWARNQVQWLYVRTMLDKKFGGNDN